MFLPQRYSPVVEAGSDVVFRWTIDDKQSLTFHNVVFNVIYQSAAIFKLSVGGGGWRGLGSADVWVLTSASVLLPLATLRSPPWQWVSAGRSLSRGLGPFAWESVATHSPQAH